MEKRTIIAGNWKMHLDVEASISMVKKLEEKLKDRNSVEVVICPTSLALHPVHEQLKKSKSDIKLGAQNIHHIDEGAYTGEISAPMVKDLVDYVIVGHSERRHVFGERDEEIARKLSAVIRCGMTPILCIGETLIERQEGETSLVIHDQLMSDLAMLTGQDVKDMVIAYEPVWAIGTGNIAKADQVSGAIKIIRKNIHELFGKKVAEQVHILYGGSVKPDYAADYLNLSGVDGVLVGGASLNAESFNGIIKAKK